MRILFGSLAVLGLAVLGLGWQLKVAWAESAASLAANTTLRGEAVEREQQALRLQNRFDALDQLQAGLTKSRLDAAKRLEIAEKALEDIKKTEGDTDASLACLNQRLPAELDDRLL